MIWSTKKWYKFFVVLFLVLNGFIWSCSKKGGSGGPSDNSGETDVFKKEMLENYADNLIIPGYSALDASLVSFENAANDFIEEPSETTQSALKAIFKESYLKYEAVSLPFLGPASALLLNNYANSFPANINRIEDAISSGSYSLTQPLVSDSIQGFPALDYLLFSNDAIERFNAVAAESRKNYCKELIARLRSLTNNTLTQWQGNYRSSFVNSLKTDVGSSIGFLVNQFAYEMDALKGPRIGYPFGKQSNGIVFADKSEGYYAGISKELAIANLNSLKGFYTGGTGKGISEYLVLLKKEQLNGDVLAQFDVALSALNDIPAPLSTAFTANAPKVEEAYKQVQKLLTLIKTDVASATAVQITYMDNDGD